jgi:hypothetical protein
MITSSLESGILSPSEPLTTVQVPDADQFPVALDLKTAWLYDKWVTASEMQKSRPYLRRGKRKIDGINLGKDSSIR